MKLFLSKKFLLFFLIANLYIFVSNIPFISLSLNTKTNDVFNYSHIIWSHDYNLYLSAITQGKNGAWVYTDAYTSEPTKPGLFYVFYVWLGKIAALLNFSASLAYHLSRIILLELFVILVYILADNFLGKNLAFWGALFAITGTISPPFLFKSFIVSILSIPWWTGFEALERLNTLPHYLFTHVLFFTALISQIYFLRKSQIKYAFLSAILVFLAGIVFPSVLAPAALANGASLLFLYFRDLLTKRKIVIEAKIFFGILIIIISVFFSLVAIKFQEKQGFPWNTWTFKNVYRWNIGEPDFDYNLLFTFGILSILSLPAIVKILKSKGFEYLFLAFWAILPFFLSPFANLFWIPKLRLIEDAHFVPFGILAAFTLFKIAPNSKIRNVLLLLFLIITIPVTIISLQEKIKTVTDQQLYTLFYLSKEEQATIKFVADFIPKNSVILSTQRLGNHLPALAPVVSYFGHMALTDNFEYKEKELSLFYSQNLKDKEAKEFLAKNKISYVYFGKDEKMLNSADLNYSFLNPIYKNNDIILYQMK